MSKRTREIQAPDLPHALTSISIETESISSHSYYETGMMENATIRTQANHVTFSELHFKSVYFEESQLALSKWTDVVFEKCDLSNSKIRRAQFNRVLFIDCKLVGTDFDESSFGNVQFIRCQAQLSAWNLTKCKNVRFDECHLKSASFFESKFTHLQFGTSQIDDIQFTGTPLAGVDFSQCDFHVIHAAADDLLGSMIAPDQAVAFVKAFGIKVKE